MCVLKPDSAHGEELTPSWIYEMTCSEQ
jgi:hypothetical protein